VPQAHKVALVDLPAGTAVRRYGVVIGRIIPELLPRHPNADGVVGLEHS
jgi:hypothetical protein